MILQKQKEIQEHKKHLSERALERKIKDSSPPREFVSALLRVLTQGDYALITEIKKGSPSQGIIREDFHPSNLARECTRGGATCLSVLTDRRWFYGRIENLEEVRRSTHLPVLQKDFVIDVWQVKFARALGANSILLVLSMLSEEEARELEALALELGLSVLIETHNEAEIHRALQMDSPLIGINNRNLETMTTNKATSRRLLNLIPPGRLAVVESGMETRADLEEMSRYGGRCFLIGTSLMCQKNVEDAVKKLLKNP